MRIVYLLTSLLILLAACANPPQSSGQLAYISRQDNRSILKIVDVSRRDTLATYELNGTVIWLPLWSVSGKYISVLTSDGSQNTANTFTLPGVTSEPFADGRFLGIELIFFSWGHEDNLIYFVGRDGDIMNPTYIYEYERTSGELRKLMQTARVYGFSVSRCSRSIAYSYTTSNGDSRLGLLNNPVPIYIPPLGMRIGTAIWSPDCVHLAFVEGSGDENEDQADRNLVVLNTDDFSTQSIEILFGSVGGADWSPDGKQIVFAAGEPPTYFFPNATSTEAVCVKGFETTSVKRLRQIRQ